MRRAGLHAACLLIAAGALAGAARAQEGLQPYQMVRSLQLVQDRLAAGDHAAMPMQVKLLELTDTRFKNAGAEDFREPRNLRALLVYGMSGGNPATIKAAVGRIEMDATDKAVAEGVIAYLGGQPAVAIKAFDPIDPMTLPADLGAFVALVKGSLLASEEPVKALALLDQARLLSPGTLVEEAALRRSVGIAVETGDAARFALASTQYTARFLHSPYASQFADSFVSGVIALNMSLSLDKIADITGMMDSEREKVIYLRIARRAAIDGLAGLSAFASAKAEQDKGGNGSQDDPRALLYASLSNMTSAKVDDLRATLGKIDRGRLSDADRSLLDAAEAITREMTAPAKARDTDLQKPMTEARAEPAAAPAIAASPADGLADPADAAGLPPVEGIESERPAGAAPAPLPEATAVPPAATKTPPVAMAATQHEGPAVAAADAVISDTKRKLDQIDQLLGASPQ
jgi:chemotaxis protein MotC